MWSWFDLIAPIGIGLLAGVLCTLGFLKAKAKPAKVICILTGLVFLASIPYLYFMRWSSRKADYTTAHGMRVRQGAVNKCAPADIQTWENDLIVFWSKSYPNEKVTAALKDALLVCKDVEKISIGGIERFFRGYSTGTSAVIGYRPNDPAYTKSLFRHEVSHILLFVLGVPWDEAAHHEAFKKAGLGA